MNTALNNTPDKQTTCSHCGKPTAAHDLYQHNRQHLCETCIMDIRTRRTRKTHWQYLRSIKTEYIRD